MVEQSSSQRRSDSVWPTVVLFGGIALVLLWTLSSQSARTTEPKVFFQEPSDGATVPTTFIIKMGVEGLTIEPAGEVHEGAGHFHILVDVPLVEPGQVIPVNVPELGYLHFGKGQLETELTLEPGEHILRLQFADGAHIALEGDQYWDEIRIIVQ